MALNIKKFSHAVVSIFCLTLSIFLAEGQSTAGCREIEDQQIARIFGEFESYFREAIGLTRSVRSDIQNLKDEIEMLKNRIEDHDKSANSSYQDLKRQLLAHNLGIKSQSQMQRQQPGRRNCPEGFNYSAAGFPKCYAVLKEKVDWNTAQERCRQLNENAQLAVIINSREQQIIIDIVKNLNCEGRNTFPAEEKSYGVNAVWIGARRRLFDCNLPFEWSSNNETTFPIQYSNWAPGEPNCSKQSEACLSLNRYHSNMWNDLTCTWSGCPLCEVAAYA